jgi:hypothetical protein
LKDEQRRAYYRSVNDDTGHLKVAHSTRDSTTKDATFPGAQDAVAHASNTEAVFSMVGGTNVLPLAHVFLAFLKSMAFVPKGLLYVEG